MRQDKYSALPLSDAHLFNRVPVLSADETMGQIVVEILRAGKNLNRKALCSKLLRRIEVAGSAEEEKHYQELIRLVLERDA
ncbi:regulatory protein YcgZ [Rouxiella chamberiensis]|uniref:Regulatory protein YcgZ n=1 Tax=Rouxiella chamberiensis TaxID=1513468 RepID=A0ABY7HTH7_9GAMM|nr:regulatory protein YcgZ [Rouxiella chamberiensis]WAT02116.1 regulatory protein YcgZ [Rouxiella chamberiensis]